MCGGLKFSKPRKVQQTIIDSEFEKNFLSSTDMQSSGKDSSTDFKVDLASISRSIGGQAGDYFGSESLRCFTQLESRFLGSVTATISSLASREKGG